jgi:hypothetical protein
MHATVPEDAELLILGQVASNTYIVIIAYYVMELAF